MVLLNPDRREIEANPNPEAERRVHEIAARYLDVRLELARELLVLERAGTHHLSACSSIVHYAVRLGIPASEARSLVNLARTLDVVAEPPYGAEPGTPARTVEDLVRSGEIPVENAALICKVLHAGLAQPGEDWVHRAAKTPTAELRRRVNERVEQAAQGERELVPVTMHVPERMQEDFHRARVIASREAAMSLTEGQAFAVVVRHYLAAKDELRREARMRRAGPTSAEPRERYVPAEVKRAVLERSGDRCEVPGCTHDTFLEYAHVRAHADGGDREASNLLRLCHVHHVQFDAGCLLFLGWRDGHPVFGNARGEELSWRRTNDLAPHAASEEDVPGGLLGDGKGGERPAQVSERPPPDYAVA